MARVLVVDDEPGLRGFLGDALEMGGHEVERAADGDAALELARRQGFHVVVTDLRMPGRDGMQLLEALKREQPEIEVIVLTAHGSVDTAVEAMKLGAFDYLEKPIDGPTELRLLVERAGERRRLRANREALRGGDAPPIGYGAPAMAPVMRAIERVAPTEATVLLTGESGTGKEVAARAIHAASARAEGPFVAVNCAVLSRELLESELFGHERGAFTGAERRRQGKIELAEGGTFFLDEIGELAVELQAKLLRVLEERVFERVGGNQAIRAEVRWIAATNRDLEERVRDGSFREDLYHRLAVFPVELPSLARRREDIPTLAERLLERVALSLGRPGLRFGDGALEALAKAEWPGNIRELANTIERSAILAEGPEIAAEELAFVRGPGGGAHGARAAAGGLSLAELEERAIREALERHGGHRKRAAEELGIGLRTLYEKLKRYEIE